MCAKINNQVVSEADFTAFSRLLQETASLSSERLSAITQDGEISTEEVVSAFDRHHDRTLSLRELTLTPTLNAPDVFSRFIVKMEQYGFVNAQALSQESLHFSGTLPWNSPSFVWARLQVINHGADLLRAAPHLQGNEFLALTALEHSTHLALSQSISSEDFPRLSSATSTFFKTWCF